MTTNPADSNRRQDWASSLIIALWILLFLAVIGIGGTAVFWKKAARARETADALAAERDAQTAKLADAENQLATLTAQRNALITQRDALPIPAAPPAVAQDPAPLPKPPARPALPPPPDAALPLGARLDAEFNALLADDPNAPSLREAARLLAEGGTPTRRDKGGRSSGGNTSALQLIREHRSKAAVPLLMKYLSRQTESSRSRSSPASYSDTLTILTGEDFSAQSTDTEADVERLYNDWWLKNRQTLTTDLNRMTDAKRRRIVDTLTRLYSEISGNQRPDSATYVNNDLVYVPGNYAAGNHMGFYRTELCPAMLPLLLERAGCADPLSDPPPEITEFPFAIVPMLASLRRDGQAPDLDKIADDDKQPAIARLACLLALYNAGDRIDGSILIALSSRDKHLSTRLICIESMRYAPSKVTTARLIAWLDDPNEEIRAAAVWGLEGNTSPEVVPAIKRVLETLDTKSAIYPAIQILKNTKDDSSAAALAGYLHAAAADRGTGYDLYLYEAIFAFSQVSGCPIKAGGHPKEEAAEAYSWWLANKGPKN